MLTDLTLKFAAVGFVLGMVGYAIRHRHPRPALFLISMMIFSLSSWVLASTYELAVQGKAHIVSLQYGTFAKTDRSDDFTTSVWVHSALGLGILMASVAGMAVAFIKQEIHFKR